MTEYQQIMRDYHTRTTADMETLGRVAAGLERSTPSSQGFRWSAWRTTSVVMGVLTAAVVVARLLVSSPPDPVPEPERPIPGGPGAFGPHIQLDADGEGRAWSRVAPGWWSPEVERFVHWRSGRLTVEVEEAQGERLQITTDEAEIRVIGTGLSVERDTLGTHVRVSHGAVGMRCRDDGRGAVGPSSTLTAGAGATCLPATAIGALGRIRTLYAQGEQPKVLLEALDDARARPDLDPTTTSELGVVWVSVLLDTQQSAEARDAAELTLRLGSGPREADLRRIAARLAVAAGDCAAAQVHLAALQALGPLGPDAALFTSCPLESP